MLSELCLHQIFAEQVARRPDAPAVSDGHEELTYRQLDERASRLAAAILRQVSGPGARVGLCLRRGNSVVVAILAVLRAGCAYVPLDPDYPPERVSYMARDASVELVLTDPDSDTAPAGAPALRVDESLWAPDAPRAEAVPVTPEAPAYVIYTSGSSGQPKGVVVSHRSVTALLAACDQVFDTDGDDVWTLFHSYSFDFSVWELWGALSHGAKLVVVPAHVARSPESTLALLRAQRVTVLNQVPSVFRYLSRAATDPRPGTEAEAPLALRYVIFGGEAVDVEAVRDWRRFHGRATEFVNMYGITETTVFSTYRRLPSAEIDRPGQADASAVGEPAPDPSLNIGLPLDGFDLAVLDQDGLPVGPGEIGEIHLGYPVLSLDGGTARRYYRSGDLAVARLDGTLEFAGRADDQVKINGYRIEIGEVESALRSADGVDDLVVVPATSRIGEPMLVAFYTTPDGRSADGLAGRLVTHAKETLPAFMLPGRFVNVPALPLSPSGKTDRRALTDQLRQPAARGTHG